MHKLAAVFGEPFGDSSVLPTHYLSRETRLHVKVALSGDGADELFGGYDRYRAMRLSEKLKSLPFSAMLAARIPGRHPKSKLARFGRLLAGLPLRPERRYLSYLAIFSDDLIEALAGRPLTGDAELREALTPEGHALLREDGRKVVPPELVMFIGLVASGRDVVQAALAWDRIQYLPQDLLTKVDRASMLHALEVRSPFMDHELVQFAAGLTTDQLIKGGPKRMLREAFAADLPDFVFKRKKMGFAVPIGDWLRQELRPMLHDNLFASDSFAREHFNLDVVRRLIEEHESFRVDYSQRLYALLMLELWHRQFNLPLNRGTA